MGTLEDSDDHKGFKGMKLFLVLHLLKFNLSLLLVDAYFKCENTLDLSIQITRGSQTNRIKSPLDLSLTVTLM